MARQTHTPKQLIVPKGSYAADSLDTAPLAADATNKEQVRLTGKEVILARNSGATPRTVSVSSVPLFGNGRTGDLTTYSIGAGETAVLPVFPLEGWLQADGNLYFEASHAEVLFTVLRLP